MISVLFVCLGNICRSPLAEGVFRQTVFEAGLEQAFEIDSAGTGSWHSGSAPDPRSIGIAADNGIDITGLKARQVRNTDFDTFDLILAMDRDNLETLRHMAEPGKQEKVRLFLTNPDQEVPDPYYGGEDGFNSVYQMVKHGSLALLKEIQPN